MAAVILVTDRGVQTARPGLPLEFQKRMSSSARQVLDANGDVLFQPASVTTAQSRFLTRSEFGRLELPSRPASTLVLLK